LGERRKIEALGSGFERVGAGGRVILDGADAPLEIGASAAKRLEDLLGGG
jgi:hypothetical protein